MPYEPPALPPLDCETADLQALRARIATLEEENAALRSEPGRIGAEGLAAIAEQSGDFVGIADTNGHAVYVNEAGRRLIGLPDLDAVRRTRVVDCFEPEDRLTVEREAIPAAVNGGSWEGELRFRHFETSALIPVLFNIFSVHDAHGKVVGYGTITRDLRKRKGAEEALRQQSRLTKAITDNAAVALFIMDERQQCVFMNPAAEELTGFTLAEVSGRPLHNVIHHTRPDGSHFPLEECAIDRAFPERAQMQGEEVFVHKDGHFYPVAYTASPILESGRPVGTIIEVQDITARKRTEMGLARSERRYRSFVEASAQVIWRVNPAAEVDEPIPAWQSYTGRTFGEAQGLGWMNAIRESDRPSVATAWHEAIADKGIYEVEYRLLRHDGAWRTVRARGVPVRDDAGTIIEWIGTCIDIEEQRAVEAQLAKSEARLSLAMEGTSDGLWDWEIPSSEVFYSPRWIEMLGYTPEEWESTYDNWQAHIHPEDLASAQETLQKYLGGELPEYVNVFRMRHKDGSWRWMMSRAKAYRDAQGQPVRMVGTHTDITAQKQAEEELRLHREELARLVEERTAELLHAAEERRRAEDALRQSEKLAALGQLTGGVAHDFNNMLQIVSSGAQLLQRATLTEERKASILERMIQAGQRARDLTNRLLAFARRQSLAPETFDLNARLTDMVELLRQTMRGVHIETDFAADLWPVYCDPSQLEVALLNIAVNARDAMPNGGTLTLQTRPARLDATVDRAAGDYVSLSVKDTGVGMPPAVLSRAFEPFFTTKGVGKGTGLGLAQVFGFAKQSGGDIHVESEIGRGATIVLHLPRGSESMDAATAAAVTVVQAMQTSAGKTVLVVDDNLVAGEFATQMLEELGYHTRLASSGAEALAMLAEGKAVDALFSDVVMPGRVGGIELATICRKTHPHVAIVLTTGYSQAVAESRAPREIEVLTKPYRQDELAAVLGRAFAALPAHAAKGSS